MQRSVTLGAQCRALFRENTRARGGELLGQVVEQGEILIGRGEELLHVVRVGLVGVGEGGLVEAQRAVAVDGHAQVGQRSVALPAKTCPLTRFAACCCSSMVSGSSVSADLVLLVALYCVKLGKMAGRGGCCSR